MILTIALIRHDLAYDNDNCNDNMYIIIYNDNIKAWLGGKRANGGLDATAVYGGAKDKLFDVFISYAGEDAEFVEQTFAQNLEHGTTSYR